MNDYLNPLVERYASKEMSALFSPATKFKTWRKLWIALAEAQKKIGLNLIPITEAQIEQLRSFQDNLNLEVAKEYEKKLRHDVMAHIHAYGEQCPAAKSIIHLGATSAYVGDNTDLILIRDGFQMIRSRLLGVMGALANFAEQYKTTPTLSFTHFQPAQLTTVGKRACMWLQDLQLDLAELDHFCGQLKFLGVKGTTGTQASFLHLFEEDESKVLALDRMVAQKMGFAEYYPIAGQTYPRKVDTLALGVLASLAQSCYKFAEDLRLLSHLRELEEPFEKEQVGSSAMAYKQNPIRSERICALARFVISLVPNGYFTAATQWFERTLDDSANRRLTIPQSFLAVDAILLLFHYILNGIRVNETKIAERVAEELPFLATEPLLMEACKRGGDRQSLHEVIRKHSVAVREQVQQGGKNDLLEKLQAESVFKEIPISEIAVPERVYGRCPAQVSVFLDENIRPLLKDLSSSEEISLRV